MTGKTNPYRIIRGEKNPDANKPIESPTNRRAEISIIRKISGKRKLVRLFFIWLSLFTKLGFKF
jgi:hypothetical protein